jgi:hypothetical protein
MKNETLLATRTTWNAFTKEVKKRCEKDGSCMVKLRDGSYRKIRLTPPDLEDDKVSTFEADDFCSWWYPSGNNVTTGDWDMIEIDG